MNDQELIDLIAQIWTSHGGDAIGFEMLYYKIKAAIEAAEKKVK